MNQLSQHKRRGSYTANLLGNIRSHVAGLHGYDVMALELIQNADDAKAETIVFDITNEGLYSRNSGRFTYCGDLDSNTCEHKNSLGYICDYHRIVDMGGGGKLLQSENIGRFGIGFLATYQITDHPEIYSSGIKLTLFPESSEWAIEEPYDEPGGTTFFLPWARDPRSEVRLGLGMSPIDSSQIDLLAADLKRVLRHSLLFLRHIRSAEVCRDSELLLSCELERDNETKLQVSFSPGGEVQQWHILRADAADAASRLHEKFPQLTSLNRSTQVSIGLRTKPEMLSEGFLYAYLPTEQLSGLPVHINADFFPEPDRKAVIFSGHQHERAWNEILIMAAAKELARDPEGLLSMIGHVQFWAILSKAYELENKGNPSQPECYTRIWEQLKATLVNAHIVRSQDGSTRLPSEVFLPRSPLTDAQVNSLLEVGGRIASEDLRPFQPAMGQLGAQILTPERMVNLLVSASPTRLGVVAQIDRERLTTFYVPLWSIINDLIPEPVIPNSVIDQAIQRMRSLPIIVTNELSVVSIDMCYHVHTNSLADRVASILPGLALATRHLQEFPKLYRLTKSVDLGIVVSHIDSRLKSENVENVIGSEPDPIRELYYLLVDLDDNTATDSEVYASLRGLPIWRTSHSFVKASEALLPGDFTDPLGQTNLLDTSILVGRSRDFVLHKLGVKTQTIKTYVESVLPNFFNSDGPMYPNKYSSIISELANHHKLLDEEDTRKHLSSLPLVPTKDGGWSPPSETYRRSEELVVALGEATGLWLDESRVPNTRSVHTFLDSVGIRRSATARHLVNRILDLVYSSSPTDETKRACSDAFYVLCDNYDRWKHKPSFDEAIGDLKTEACLPASEDAENWHRPDTLYSPFRAESFSSQEQILDFRNRIRLNTDLLRDLGVIINPPTELVINHLKYCMEKGIAPHTSTYQVLNERAASDPLVKDLAGSACIYVENQDRFLRTNQVYWAEQQLGRYAFTIPQSFDPFKPLFREIGVKDAPEFADYIDILIELVGDHYERSTPVANPDRTIYYDCLGKVAAARGQAEYCPSELIRLRQAPSILSLEDVTSFPDEILLHDSEWYYGFFGTELNQVLCILPAELCSLAMDLGVRRLSECTSVSLEYIDGVELDETELAEKLMERTEIFTRLLYDQPTVVKDRVRAVLAELGAVSHDVVQIKATVQLADSSVSSPPTSVKAFFDIENRRLTVCRPIDDRIWAQILNAIFHQLIPEATGNEISKLTLGVRPLMDQTVSDAHRDLTDAGVPNLKDDFTPEDAAGLASQELDELGTGVTNIDDKENDSTTVSGDDKEPELNSIEGDEGDTLGVEDTTKRRANDAVPEAQRGRLPTTSSQNQKRPKYKDRWNRRLLSYVQQNQDGGSEGTVDRSESSEHNLAVEVCARKAACIYEKERGRNAQEMTQTHPGYDIISYDPDSDEERLIEVKGIDGEWNQTGVGLSRIQFSNAQDHGDRYWLYVVEFAMDSNHARVHAIQNPAMKITSFMFDGNWRDATTNEHGDPTLRFVPGARIHHEHFGTGKILGIVMRGSTKLLSVKFESGNQVTRTVSLNVHRMRILEDGNGDDNT